MAVNTDRAEASPHPHRRPRRRPGENRERLLTAGIAEFGTHGYHGSSTAAIAALAEVPQPHVYANFSNKAQLFLSCAERAAALLEDLRTTTAQQQASTDQPLDLAQLARFVLQAVAALGDETLGDELSQLLVRIRQSLGGQHGLDELIRLGSLTLLEQRSEP